MSDSPTIPQRPARQRRRLRALLGALIVIVVLAGAAVAADRLFHALTERRIVSELAAYTPDGSEPEAEVAGFPFLTQYASGQLDEVRIAAPEIDYDGLVLSEVTVDARAVPTDLSRAVGEVGMSATVPEGTLTELLARDDAVPDDLAVSVDGSGVLLTGRFLGMDVEARVAPRPDGRAIVVDVESVRLGSVETQVDSLPSLLGDLLQDLRIDLDALPSGLELSEIEPVDGGLQITARGTGVYLPTG